MSEAKRLNSRNEQVAAMLSDGEQLKNFYRFIAQNPHINLHDACQIIVERPNATVCFSFNEWAAMDRRVTKGRKGIAYYDHDGYKQFVFDANDTHGDNRYSRPILPMKRLLGGLDELNDTDLSQDERSDYRKIHKGVQLYLQEQDALTGDITRDKQLIDGITYSLYAKTGFPKSAGIRLDGLPYSYAENAEFVKDVYIRTDMLVQDIEEAYSQKRDEVPIIDDSEEEAVSDEPIIPVGQMETKAEEQSAAEPKHPLLPMYEQYMKAQKTMPNAVVLMRVGDFYEVLGEKAKIVADELNLTLTGREVGLPERVPMCGMSYHAMDVYLDKILVHHGVLLVEPNEEPKYILSHAETIEQEAEAKEEKTKPTLTEMPNDEPTPFDNEQPETDDWRSELLDELEDTDDGQPSDIDELDDDEDAEETDGEDYEVAEDMDEDETNEQTEQGSESKDEVKSTPKEKEKGIKDRKRKEKPQLSMFDLLDPKAQSAEEALIERQLKYGSGVQHGKYRIFDKYNENPTLKTFADFLKNEYGWGGHGAWNDDEEMHDAKGITMSVLGEKGEVLVQVKLKWPEVATRIADLIDDDIYLSEQEKKEYVEYKAEQNRLREQRLEQERRRDKFLEKILTDEPRERKERIEEAYHKAESTEEFISFVKQEYGAYTTKELDGQSIVFNDYGVFVSENGDTSDISSRYSASWAALEKKFAALINANNYIEPIPQPEQPDDEEDWDALIDARVAQPVATEEHVFNRFKELTEKGKKIFDAYQNGYMSEPTDSPWDYVQNCTAIANGIYDVSTEGHGGVMIATGLAPHILSPEALEIGFIENGYYCYEEDCDASVPLRELYDKGILNEEQYFREYRVKSERPEAQNGYVPFREANESERADFLNGWNNSIDESLKYGHPEYWQAHEQAEMSVTAVLTPEQEKIVAIVDRIVKEGTENTTSGNWVVYLDEFKEDEPFVREHLDEILHIMSSLEEVAEVTMDGDGIDATYYLDFCPNYEDIWHEFDDEEKSNNTDLNGVLDQNELGGAKTRFRNNVAAIKLVNMLYAENRNASEAEKKVLSQFVGWGGLSQAFDENNPQWAKEYAELKGLLSTEDYEQAKSSTLNAYYTAKDVIGGIYAALGRFGVKGNNRILEPSMGTGNFFGFMPKEIADGSRLYGVELDNLTGRIAAKLYPQANVQIKGFEDTSFPDDKFDIVVGNVPFGGYGVADSAYNRYNFKVHDYFLAKSIDKVKPNGIVAIVTSKGTMDKLNPSARKYVAERAELLGAIRLPNTAFKQTAGTEAVADILFFRKRTEKINADAENIEWLGTGKTEEGYEINNYFIKHPEMVLGTLAEETGLYGGKDVTVKPDGRELSEALGEAVKNLPQGFYAVPETSPTEESAIEVDYNVKPMCYKADSGRLYMRVGDEMVEQRIPAFPKDAYQRLQGMIALREELHRILDIQIKGCSDEVLAEEQERLNEMYDTFVKKYGELNGQTNARLFKDDGDAALLFACEDIDKETKKASKAEIFYKRTIRPYIVPTNTDDPFEALQISKNERGRVDIAYIEELTGKDYDSVLFELGDSVFRNPKKVTPDDKYSGFETAEEYLSGRVVDKLGEAEYYAESNPEYKRNVEALKQVQPTKLTASEISARLGATWIDKEFYKQFYCELVGVSWWRSGDVELFYNPFDSSWRLDQKDSVRSETQMKQKEVYGTKRAPAYRLFIDAMNMRSTTIYDTIIDADGKERRILNQPETIAAREKQNQIKELFTNWIYAKPQRREELEATYNRLFNQIRLPSYDGSYLKFPEMNPAIELNPHQKNAVHRIITSPDSTLLHHVVGSGKTYTMVASIMKMRQLGICKKAMVAVPNHLVEQWAGEWRKLYPSAKILVATKEDLEKENRQRFVSKVAMGDWDGIIIAQSSFAKIPISQERQIKKLRQEIKLIEETVHKQWEENGMPRGAVKNLERIKKSREAMLKKLMDGNKKDDVLTFENLGVDYLYIDEAHYYKNLFLFTKMNNVAGVSNAASQRASDLKLKCEYLQELHGSDKGVVFGTGTPISNSMSEMYTMQSYLQPSALRGSGIEFFDGWAADFGETITSMELSPSGQGYRARTRFAKFTNLPELLTMYRSFADVQTQDMVKLNVPEAEKHVINLKPSDTTIELAEQIAERAEKIHDRQVSPEEDNMLKITSDGKKLALDPRCFVPDSEDEAGNKLNEAARRIYEIWQDTTERKGTQIVFCDLSTPKKRFEDYEYGTEFDAYNDLKYKLVQKGIPKDEIAFIHDATSEEQKQDLFDSVNSGAVRVLIGSTEKCGAGTNVQKRLVALHHLDTPYRPSDMEQREGRIIRQGNENKKVDIYTYVTERTFDSYSYQILENKQKFISQINKGDLTVREAEDIDETTLSYAEIKAITAANPKIKRKMEVDAEISRLRVLEGQYKKNLYELQDKILKDFPEDIRKQELLIERVTADIGHLQESKPADPGAFEISVNGKVYTDRKEGGKALTEALYKSKPETVVAEYYGFKISMNPISMLTATEREITLAANGQYTMKIGESASGNLTRLDNFIEEFPARKERLENRLKQMKDDLEIAKEQVQKPFEHKDHLLELLNEQTALNAELDLDKKDDVIVADDGEDDDNYRALPTQRKIQEDDIIDKEDKVASMQVDVLPDYTVSTEDMHKYGYTWDGMLPMRKDAARRAFERGVQVYYLGRDDTESEAESLSDFEDGVLYGVEKPVWNKYLESEHGRAYMAARSQFAESAGVVASGEMDSVDERFTIDFIETNYEERADLDDYLASVPATDTEAMKCHIPELLDEYASRIWRDELQYYGWEKDSVRRAIADHIENAELKAAAQEINGYSASQKQIDYENEVIESVKTEYDAFQDEMLNSSPQTVFENSYKTHLYTDFSEVIQYGKEYLTDKEFQALYEERGHILNSLYDDYIKQESYSVETYGDTAHFIKDYCEKYHNNTYYPTTYYGKDTENRAYYRFSRGIAYDNIKQLEKSGAEMYTIAAPSCTLSQEELERNHIFYLNIGRDITEEAFADDNKAMGNMMNAMDNYKRIYPLYLKTGEYAHEHYEIIDHRNSRKSNIECKLAIEDAIRNNFDGMHLNEGIEYKIIEQYGMDRVAFVVANTVNEHNWDGRFSRENKEWAKTVPMSEDENVRSECCLTTHPAVLDAFINRIRKKIKEEENKLAQDKFKNFTARGDKVLSIIKDKDDRNIAIIQRKNDFVVAARYDTTDGKWGQGIYDFKTLEEAEAYREEKYGFENTEDTDKKKWVKFKISPEALIRKYQFNSRFMMPKGSGYEGCAYSIFNDRISESTITTDVKSDTRERALEIRIPEDYKIELYEGNEKIIDFRAWEFAKMVDGTTSDKYEREARLNIRLPREAVIKDYDTSVLVAAPTDSEYKGYVYYLPSSVVKEDTENDNGSLVANVGENFKITLRKGEEKIELTAKQFTDAIAGKNDYKREPTALDEYREQSDDEKKWSTVQISENAVIANYENSTLFKMPKGENAGFVYYIPSGMVRKEDDGLYLRVPEDFIAHLKDGENKKDLSAQEFIAAIDGKTDEDYESVYRAPSEETKAQFAKVERNLRANVPEEMLKKPNWVVVRTRENKDTGRLDKFLINPHTGKFAESDNPETWADFDTACKYAKEQGGVCLAYALDGKDGIACIDLDGCMQENGDFSDIAQKAFIAASGSYAEKSVSGKGLHIFGKTKGADLRSFSKDKTMEYYQGGHFIAMTGDDYGSSELKSFDTPEMKTVLESKLEKRTEWKHTGEGVEGLSSMDDREMLEKAFKAKNGDTVKKLYNGEDLRGNHSNSDMSLMNYLAFWSNHDIDQMLRVFATSGLYRADKPQSYYEHTAIKAVKGTPVYNPPKASNAGNNKPSGNGSGSGKGGK